jgi:hypothetical protein
LHAPKKRPAGEGFAPSQIKWPDFGNCNAYGCWPFGVTLWLEAPSHGDLSHSWSTSPGLGSTGGSKLHDPFVPNGAVLPSARQLLRNALISSGLVIEDRPSTPISLAR